MSTGEGNTDYNTDLYNCTFPAMIEDWRRTWHQKTKGRTNEQFPFGFMQVKSLSIRMNEVLDKTSAIEPNSLLYLFR